VFVNATLADSPNSLVGVNDPVGGIPAHLGMLLALLHVPDDSPTIFGDGNQLRVVRTEKQSVFGVQPFRQLAIFCLMLLLCASLMYCLVNHSKICRSVKMTYNGTALY
jgi:hypothetical protein